jgi:hypothetical protein
VTLSGDEAKNEWNYTSNLPHVFTACCLFKERGNLRSDSDSGKLIKLYDYIKLCEDIKINENKCKAVSIYTAI